VHDQLINRILDPEVMNMPLGPGKRIVTKVISSFEGDTSCAGEFATPEIFSVVGLGPVTYDKTLDYVPIDLSHFHDERKRRLSRNRSLVN
jgi:hypothetical protein